MRQDFGLWTARIAQAPGLALAPNGGCPRSTPVRRDLPEEQSGMSPAPHDRRQRDHIGASAIVA
jgi:hypothetical protein